MKEHSTLSALFGTTVAGTLLEKTVDMMSIISPHDPVVIGAGLVLGSMVGGLAGYASSYHFNALMKASSEETRDTYKRSL